ncbi:phosphoketolase, partial [Nocardia otitidiscaviarum]|uniref:phosphoketolase family protein n=1 Tax=Nocardia otitidiscaviarum TaxID=1823 RepID=UPI000E0FE9F4
ITPLIPGHDHLGGQLGPALAISHGMALDAPDRLVVALIGDGECETGATAAAWLGARALTGTGTHGRVLPVVLANGLRMGAPALLAGLGTDALTQHLSGLGYRVITAGPDTAQITTALAHALTGLAALEHGPSTVLVITVDKGHGAPETVGAAPIARTPRVHKTPLRDPRRNPAEFAALQHWLTGYRPAELFTADAAPAVAVRTVLDGGSGTQTTVAPPRRCLAAAHMAADRVAGAEFGAAISRTLRDLHTVYGLRVFSPDELSSNRVDPTSPADPGWVIEVLNEELCHAWAQGCHLVDRRALVLGYEAFAPITASLLTQQLITNRLAVTAGRAPGPSPVYLLTSLGWHNTISHANPSMVDVVIGLADPRVHVYLPADAPRTAAAALTFAVRKLGRAALVIASKHRMPEHPRDTLAAELRDGYAIWPHIADTPDPELVLVSAGDVAARELCRAAADLRADRPAARVRYVHVHDLSCLGAPGQRDAAIPADVFEQLFPPGVPILVATISRTAPVHALFGERGAARAVTVRGWVDPPHPMTPDELLDHSGMAAAALTRTARDLLDHATTRTDSQGVA